MIALSAKSVLCLPLPPQSQCCGREFGISVSRARQNPFPTLRLGGNGGWWVRLGKLQLSFAPGGAQHQQTHVSSITLLVNMLSFAPGGAQNQQTHVSSIAFLVNMFLLKISDCVGSAVLVSPSLAMVARGGFASRTAKKRVRKTTAKKRFARPTPSRTPGWMLSLVV